MTAASTPLLGIVHRLAFGLEVYDALTDSGTDAEVVVEWPGPVDRLGRYQVPGRSREAADATRNWQPLTPSGSEPGRFHVNHRAGVRPPVTVRITDPRRRFVARRFDVRFPPLAELVAAENAGRPPRRRSWRIGVWPGSSYSNTGGRSGLRGRLADGLGRPVPWGRVVARLVVRNTVADAQLGVAHADERGEFLLLFHAEAAATPRPRGREFYVELSAWAPPLVTRPGYPDDPLAALPVRDLRDPGTTAGELIGTALPRGAVAGARRRELAALGRIRSLDSYLRVPPPVPAP